MGELGEIVTGSTPPIANEEYYSDKGIPWITPTDIETNIISDSAKKLSADGAKIGRVVRANSILCTCIASIGKNALLTTNGSFNQQINSLTPYSDNDSYFLLTSSELWSIQMKQIASSGTMQIVNKTEFSELRTMIPSLPEQEAIGTFFSTLDQHIALHQRKLDKLKSVKQAYLSEMFPAEGERVPKRRFPGFTDDWELRKLRNIFHNIENAFVGIATPHYVSDGRFYLESNNIKDGQVNYETKVFISEEFYQRQKNKWLRAGDIVMVQSGHVGHSAVIPEELDCSAAHALIMFRKQKVKISSNFLNYQFQTKQSKKKLDLITTGNTIKHILSSEMKEFNANFPTLPEQKAIGTFFSTLDRQITLHQRKS